MQHEQIEDSFSSILVIEKFLLRQSPVTVTHYGWFTVNEG